MSETLGAAGDRVLAQRYRLDELVGRGALAEVYRAHDRLLDRTVAVKLFHPAKDRRFADEAHALARLTHPGLVLIYGVGAVHDRPFLVMEFVEGTSLDAVLLRGAVPTDQVARIGAVLAEGLAHAHSRGVVHHDVKASNIILDNEGLPHLTDFGALACPAPEHLPDNAAGPQADVYELALVLLECLNGDVAPPALADLLTAMTSTRPADRPTAAQCALRLLAAAGNTATSRPPAWWADEDRTARLAAPAASGRSRTDPARPRWHALAASVAGIAAVVVALVVLLNTSQPPIGRPATGGTGQAQGGANPGSDTSQPGPGPGDGRSPLTVGTLVANENPVTANKPGAVPVGSSATPTASTPPTATTSPGASTQPPSSTESDPPTTTSDPPSTSANGAPTP